MLLNSVRGSGSGLQLAFILLGFVLVESQSQTCTNPNNEQGNCVVISLCPELLNILQKKPLSPADTTFLRQSKCGEENRKPKVCCPKKNSPIQTIPSTPSPLIPQTRICGEYLEPKISGGTATDLNEFTWMALLEYTKGNVKSFKCGGALISSRYVLTAAHCIRGSGITPNNKLTGVRLGEWKITTNPDCLEGECSTDPENIPVESVLVHDGYVPSSTDQLHDIALIRLSRPVVYSEFINPVCLPLIKESVANKVFTRLNATVVGWGQTESTTDSDVKLKVNVPVIDGSKCAKLYKRGGVNLATTQLCAGGREGKDACRGDSGGPLLVLEDNNWYVLGIVSFGPDPCGQKNWPGVYTDVSKYADWISRNIRD